MMQRASWRHAVAVWALAALSALWATMGSARADDALPPAVKAALAQAGLPEDALAAVAMPLIHAAPAWGHRADVAMQPGSSMKLLTTIVALDQLGPNHRGRTELLSDAPLAGDTLAGDLVLRGGADPELGVPQLWALLLDLRQAGVRHIGGQLVLDRSRWRPARNDIGVPPFDETPEFAYNVIPDALQLAGNLLPLELQATADGVRARTVPPLPGVQLRSRLTLNDRPCRDWDEDWRGATATRESGVRVLELQGAFPRGCSERTALQLLDRDELAEQLVRALWQGLGGSWDGGVREGVAPPGARVLAQRISRPWGEVLRFMNKTSDNALSRMLFLELGVPDMAAMPGRTTRELADARVRAWLALQGLDDRSLVLDNGSGLSRSERISPRLMAGALKVAWSGRHAAELQMSLPVAGVDGTMARRLKDSPAAGWARLKTGTLRNVVGLAGYVRDRAGWPWAVAMMVNHDNARVARPVLDALVDSIVRHGPANDIP